MHGIIVNDRLKLLKTRAVDFLGNITMWTNVHLKQKYTGNPQHQQLGNTGR